MLCIRVGGFEGRKKANSILLFEPGSRVLGWLASKAKQTNLATRYQILLGAQKRGGFLLCLQSMYIYSLINIGETRSSYMEENRDNLSASVINFFHRLVFYGHIFCCYENQITL